MCEFLLIPVPPGFFQLAFFLLAALDLVNLFLSSIGTLFCMQDGIEVSVIAKLCWAILLLVCIGVAASMVFAFYKKDSGYYLAYRAFLVSPLHHASPTLSTPFNFHFAPLLQALRVLASVLFAGYMLFLVVFKEAVDQVEFGKFINNSFCSVDCRWVSSACFST